MKHLLYKVTDGLGWIFCESFFRIVDTFYPNDDPPRIIAWVLDKMYCTGNWFYSLNKEIN